MASVFDTTDNCSKSLGALMAAGYKTIVRYYSRPGLEWKRIGVKEAAAFARAGMRLSAVYQDRQNQDDDFSKTAGLKAGRTACDYAEGVIFQPAGSAIYFSADYDASATALTKAIVPFFEGVHEALKEVGSPYRVGIYGSGLTCRVLLEKGLVDYCWITQSTGFQECKKFLASGKWHLKQLMASTAAGIPGDPDEVNPSYADFGDFLLDPDHFGPAVPAVAHEAAHAVPALPRYEVIARMGLRLRAKPEGDMFSLLAVGTQVTVLSRAGEWALVDNTGDGLADGYVYAAYLRPI